MEVFSGKRQVNAGNFQRRAVHNCKPGSKRRLEKHREFLRLLYCHRRRCDGKRLAKVKGKDYWAAISDNDQEFKQFKLPVADVKELWKYRRHVDWDAGPKKKFEITV